MNTATDERRFLRGFQVRIPVPSTTHHHLSTQGGRTFSRISCLYHPRPSFRWKASPTSAVSIDLSCLLPPPLLFSFQTDPFEGPPTPQLVCIVQKPHFTYFSVCLSSHCSEAQLSTVHHSLQPLGSLAHVKSRHSPLL